MDCLPVAMASKRVRGRAASRHGTPRGPDASQVLRAAWRRWLRVHSPTQGAALAFYASFAIGSLVVLFLAVTAIDRTSPLAGTWRSLGIGFTTVVSRSAPLTAAAAMAACCALLGSFGACRQWSRALEEVLAEDWQAPASNGRERQAARHESSPARTFALVATGGFLAIGMLALGAGLGAMGAQLAAHEPMPIVVLWLLTLGASTLTAASAFAMLLRWVPSAPPSLAARWSSAMGTGFLLALGTLCAGICISCFGEMSAGAAAVGLLVVMAWAFFCAQATLFGAALAAEIDGSSTRQSAMRRGEPCIEQPGLHTNPPTSLALARSRRRSGIVPLPPTPSPRQAAVLRFPEGRRR